MLLSIILGMFAAWNMYLISIGETFIDYLAGFHTLISLFKINFVLDLISDNFIIIFKHKMALKKYCGMWSMQGYEKIENS